MVPAMPVADAPATTPTEAPLEGLRSVRGQPHAVAFLARSAANDRLASAYLFEGPEGVGKERTARALAQVTVCEALQPDGDACGKCPPCRAVARRTHVDVILLARTINVLSQKEESASNIKSELVVDKVRDLQTERLAYQTHQGTRWVLVRDAHEMNVSASNAFLKTLEEPPSRTHIVLITSQPSQLLTTIRSRCQRVRFAPLPDSIVGDIVKARGVEAAIADEATRLASGSVARAIELADPEALAGRRAWVDKVLNALRAGRPGAFTEVAESLKDLSKRNEDESYAVLLLLERHFRDEALAHAANARRAVASAARAELVRRFIDGLGGNLNMQIQLESLLVRLREVRS